MIATAGTIADELLYMKDLEGKQYWSDAFNKAKTDYEANIKDLNDAYKGNVKNLSETYQGNVEDVKRSYGSQVDYLKCEILKYKELLVENDIKELANVIINNNIEDKKSRKQHVEDIRIKVNNISTIIIITIFIIASINPLCKCIIRWRFIFYIINIKGNGIINYPPIRTGETDAGRKTAVATVRKVVANQTAVADKTHIVRIRRINATHPIIPITTTII